MSGDDPKTLREELFCQECNKLDTLIEDYAHGDLVCKVTMHYRDLMLAPKQLRVVVP